MASFQGFCVSYPKLNLANSEEHPQKNKAWPKCYTEQPEQQLPQAICHPTMKYCMITCPSLNSTEKITIAQVKAPHLDIN